MISKIEKALIRRKNGTFKDMQTTIRPPGPKGYPIVGSLLELQKDPIKFLEETAKDYPDIAKVKLGPVNFVVIQKPEYTQHVLQKNYSNYCKPFTTKQLTFVLGNGLLTNDGSFWLKQRRLIQPVFHRRSLEEFVQTMVNSTDESIKALHAYGNKEVPVHHEMTRLTMDIIGKTMLSADAGSDFPKISGAIDYLIEALITRIKSYVKLPYWMPTRKHLLMKKYRDTIGAYINSVIQERQKSGKSYNDLLGMLMAVEDADTGEKMDEKQLRDEIITIYIAGHETTANALTYSLFLLAKNPEYLDKLRQELAEQIGTEEPSFENLRKLPLLAATVNESLRLYPPAWIFERAAIEDDNVDGFLIKKGDIVSFPPWVIHHNPKFWPNPLIFKPERFLGKTVKDYGYTFLPFGGGPRICIGNNFALTEMQVVLAKLVREFNLEIDNSYELKLNPTITLRPAGEVPIRFVPVKNC